MRCTTCIIIAVSTTLVTYHKQLDLIRWLELVSSFFSLM
jgi:hypothetical protein